MKGLKRIVALICALALVMGLGLTVQAATPRKIDVWDLTGQSAGDAALYNDLMTPATWCASGALVDGTLSVGETVTFGDLSMTHNANDRIYSAVESADWVGVLGGNAQNKYGHAYDDGYEAQGGWYCNGAGGDARRFMVLANVQAGDKVVAYMGSASGDITFHFDSVGGTQAETGSVSAGEFGKFQFIAQESGAYKIWTDPAGKAMFHRIMRLPGVAVTGTVTFPANYSAPEKTLKFINQETRQETIATLSADGSFTATLAPGYTYNAALSGATGWGFTAETRQVSVSEGEVLSGKAGVKLVVEAKIAYPYSGKILGFDAGYDLSKLALTMVPEEGSMSEPVKLSVDLATMSFSGVLDPSVAYTVVMEGANDYEVGAPDQISSEGEALTRDIAVSLKAKHGVNGKFLGLELGAVTALTFENLDDGYTYPALVTNGGYGIALRDGSYVAHATVDGYATQSHVVVAGKDVTKDLLFVSTAEKPTVAWVSDVYVGYPDKANNYETVRDAVDAISRMGVASEAQRVTVHIAPGTYREQIIIETPYISFVNDQPTKEVLLTWYYGIGYKYYSAGPDGNGYYDAQRAFDKFEKHIADRWGTAVRIKPTALAFRAENITFENSFNRYITDEELADGVEPTGETLKLQRNYALDVQSKAATERAAALCVEADGAEFVNCAFLSGQDTLYTAANAYFKNCLIEGGTDYIYGSGNIVFDGCELRWKGYSDTQAGGYITAQRSELGQPGYLFRACTVTANPDLTVSPGHFGRPWGADAAVTFQNTALERNDLILPEGWTDMSGNKPENARFKEYGTFSLDGQAVALDTRVAGTTLTAPVSVNDYFDGWTPVNYQEENPVVNFATDPIITDNGDINLPKAGHTLTVGYSLGAANDANDASLIQWYAVKDGQETLVKATLASVSRSYKIQRDDVGALIKVVVTPTTFSGVVGTSKSYTLIETVGEGWDDPGAAPGDVEVGQGINIFLAGDSTVKDYSAKGMYNDGKIQLEGSWGEFLQAFFDPSQVTVVNYAQGGRSTRSFLNEGSLAKIAENIKEGDYLFIQFGHNDASNQDQSHLLERHAPVGTPDENGIYPSTPGVKQPTPAGLPATWGEECYTWDCGGTYKWYLQQYIDVARNAGATPVLITPVARMYYEPDGSIRPHHDESTAAVKNNAYCIAVRQLAQEQNVPCIDAFELTKELFELAYDVGSGDTYGKQLMAVGESTHSNKLGGVLEAALVAAAIQDLNLNISRAVKAPAKVLGETPKGETAFLINAEGKFTAYDILTDYTETAPFWTNMGQTMFDAIAAKAVVEFADVPLGHWAEEAITTLARQGILLGTDTQNRLFSPNAPVTRSSAAVMLWRLAGQPTVTVGGVAPYADVAVNNWDTLAVAWCAQNGIVQGRGDNTFGPNDPISREQLCTMLDRYTLVCTPASRGEANRLTGFGFADVSQVSSWAYEAVEQMVGRGIVQGKPGNLLDPAASVTRAECAVMLWRMLSQ